jgi:S-methylmethionine-dependent homocysteine/selenocysteine methylase
MKIVFKSLLLAGAMFCAAQSYAQSDVKKAEHGVGHAATDVGHKTSEVASKGSSAVVDKKYDGKCGPHGESIYINKKSQYYYVDKKGHRVYQKKSQLMDKKDMEHHKM